MIKVIKKGLETSVQDYPGRIGTLNQGFPPSGPMDSWSFRLANVLVQNDPGAPALECQFMGPSLKFENDAIIAITGFYIGRTEVLLWGSGIALILGLLFKSNYTSYMKSMNK